jgi:hypothetical protein
LIRFITTSLASWSTSAAFVAFVFAVFEANFEVDFDFAVGFCLVNPEKVRHEPN